MECKFCGADAEWQGKTKEIKMNVCSEHFHAHYISFGMWRKIDG